MQCLAHNLEFVESVGRFYPLGLDADIQVGQIVSTLQTLKMLLVFLGAPASPPSYGRSPGNGGSAERGCLPS